MDSHAEETQHSHAAKTQTFQEAGTEVLTTAEAQGCHATETTSGLPETGREENRIGAQYLKLREERQEQLRKLEGRGRWLGLGKLGVAALGLGQGLWFLAVKSDGWLLAIPVAVFIGLAIWHEQILKVTRRLQAAVQFYERGLARLENRWAGTGESGEEFLSASHPYARDLDLFGPGSLFELLSTARTAAGKERLAGWLQGRAAVPEILARQKAVQALGPRLELRERLFTTGGEIASGLRPEALVRWAEGTKPFGSRKQVWLASGLAVAWLGSVAAAIAVHVYLPVFLLTLVNFSLNHKWRGATEESAEAAEGAAQGLKLLAEVLQVFEQEEFAEEKLQRLQTGLRSAGSAPSEAIGRLERRVNHLSARRNLMVGAFDGILFYSLQMAVLVESWRRRHGGAVCGWLESLSELEALSALAGYASEHAEDTWPEFVEGEGARFEAEGLAHPLLPANKAVRNDLTLGNGLRLLILSGPNMAGKSTFIRGIGLNAVLAQCGAPARARRLRMSPLAVGASICVLDSLQGGISRFYAEIQRLKTIVDLASGETPTLFLLDELLSGTNSLDRRKGTEALVRALVGRGAIGLVTTHDLALTRIPEAMEGKAANAHFEDRYVEGKLVFDFELKPGAVETSNALKLMQSIGLPVEG